MQRMRLAGVTISATSPLWLSVGLSLVVHPQHPCMEEDKVSGRFASDRDGFDWVHGQSGLTLSQVRLRLGLSNLLLLGSWPTFGLCFHLCDQDLLAERGWRLKTAVHSQLVQKRLLLLDRARAAIVVGRC